MLNIKSRVSPFPEDVNDALGPRHPCQHLCATLTVNRYTQNLSETGFSLSRLLKELHM